MQVDKGLTAILAEDGSSVPTTLHWDDTDPLCVQLKFMVPGGPWVTWELALDLMAEGLASVGLQVGAGDVQVETILDQFVMHVRGLEGKASVSMNHELVSHFVSRVVTGFSAEDEARAVATAVDRFLAELGAESF